MKLVRAHIRVIILAVVISLLGFESNFALASLPMISASGSKLVDPSGSPVILKGCNLGNYLILESWMFGKTLGAGPDHSFRDGAFVYRTLRERFGRESSDHLIELYRDGWITPRDIELIKSFGFNVVRLPFDYRLIQEDQPPFAIKPDAFRRLDHAIQMCEDAGVYVILDLHGAPGGQSLEDHTGEAGQNHLWTRSEDQQRTVQVWRALADHFKNRTSVAAYDLINEPYGDQKQDCRPVLARLMPEIYQAIRSTGDQHVVFFSGALNGGIAFYGNPHNNGMKNVAFTEHYYPGLFGSTSALETQARVLTQELPAKHDYADEIASPYYVGEFNVVLSSEDAPRMMRAYYDRFAEYGWPCTMWSYKTLSDKGGVGSDAWCMATNAAPLPRVDLQNSSYEDLENFFTSLATMPLAVNDRLRDELTSPSPEPLYLASYPHLPTAPPASPPPSEPAGYTSVDLGGATPGYTEALPDGSVRIMGGGQDIFGATDTCRFVSQPADGASADVRATILSFVDSGEFAKTGVMARWGEVDHANSAMAMVNVFPDGTVALLARSRAGARAVEKKIAAGVELPVELRLQISSGQITGMYRDNSSDWKTIGTAPAPDDSYCRAGLAVCAHGDAVLTTVKARLGPTADDLLPMPGNEGSNIPIGPSLLSNGSFEEGGAQSDLAADWNRWGQWMNRETGWSPCHSGTCLIGYHHWQIDQPGSSGLWQDVPVQAGKRYLFSIYAQHDPVDANHHEAKTIELRMEGNTPGGQLTLNSKNFDVSKLPSGGEWARLSVAGTACSDALRVLVVINASEEEPRGGSVKLDDAALSQMIADTQARAHADPPAVDSEMILPADAVANRDLVYATRGGQELKLDLFRPAGDGPFPIVVWIHGGAWKLGDKSGYPHMNFLVGHGYAVANIEYRFSQVAPFPAQIEDCKSALDFLVSHAAEYHLDADRIVATGESAGGHLASLMGLDRSTHIRGVYELAGPSDLTDAAALQYGPTLLSAVEGLLGGPPGEHMDLAKQASPVCQVSETAPPFLILHGTADPIVPFSQSQRLADALKAAGADVELDPVPNAGHVGPACWTPARQEKILAFLQRLIPPR